MSNVVFVTGIDTDVGKSYVTGLLARYLMKRGESVITQKFIQTGCEEFSEDIDTHRKIMGIPYLEEDSDKTTAPVIFRYPASPHLAARLEGKEVNLSLVDKSTAKLSSKFDYVLIEGAGGIQVPITETYTTLDFLAEKKYPVILVSSPKLGSINHTYLTIDALKWHGIPLAGVVYNLVPDEKKEIREDSVKMIKYYASKLFGEEIPVVESPKISVENPAEIDFSAIFK